MKTRHPFYQCLSDCSDCCCCNCFYHPTSSPLWALEYHFAFVDCVGGAVEVVQQLCLGGGIGAASQDEGVGLLDGAPLYAYGRCEGAYLVAYAYRLGRGFYHTSLGQRHLDNLHVLEALIYVDFVLAVARYVARDKVAVQRVDGGKEAGTRAGGYLHLVGLDRG